MTNQPRDRFIVKVQLPLFSTEGTPVMVYNEDRTKKSMRELPSADLADLKKRMKNEHKAFFYAYEEAGDIVLDELAPWQNW